MPTRFVLSNMPQGFVTSGLAANYIGGGRLIARTKAGLIHYDPSILSHRYLLLGIALNSALPGEIVSLQRGGTVYYPGLDLPEDTVLLAGKDGKLATSDEGLLFRHVVGRSIGPDQFIFVPSTTFLL